MSEPIIADVLELMDAADAALDDDTYEQIKAQNFDAPDDCEIWITAGTRRKINELFLLISQWRSPLSHASPPKGTPESSSSPSQPAKG